MADTAELIRAFFDGAQPTMKLPDGTWYGWRPNDVMHDLHDFNVKPDRTWIELGGEFVRSHGGGLRLVLDGPVEAEEIRRPGVHELELRGFGRSVLEEEGNRRQWSGGTITFVRFIPQGQVPPSVLG